MVAAKDVLVVAESRPNMGVIITAKHEGKFYRIPLNSLTADFEPVDPSDTIVGPVVFTKAMEKAFTAMTEAGEAGPNIYAFQSFEDAVLLCFYRQVYGLPAGEVLSFRDVNTAAIRSGDNYPTTAADVIPAAEYFWAKAAAATWRLIKQQLGQSDDLFAEDVQPELV